MQSTRHRNDRIMVHTLTPIPEHGNVTVLWNQSIHTQIQKLWQISHIKQLETKKEEACVLIDVAKPAGKNITQKEAERTLKYRSLCTERKRMWNMKCMIIPVITEATGILAKPLNKSLEAIP